MSGASADLSFSERLRRDADDDWRAAVDHRFTRALIDGALADEVFARYLVQDYAFIDTLVRFVGYAVAKAPSMAERKRLVAFLGVLTGDENTYFQRAFDALNVDAKARRNPAVTPATRAFRKLMLSTGESGSYAEIITVFTVAEWVYLDWASAAGDARPGRFYLAEWIDLHASNDFADFVGWLRGELDREGAAATPRTRDALAALFGQAVRLEVDFFDAAYRG